MGKPGNYHHGIDKEGHIKPMTIGARLYRLENQVNKYMVVLIDQTNDIICRLENQVNRHNYYIRVVEVDRAKAKLGLAAARTKLNFKKLG